MLSINPFLHHNIRVNVLTLKEKQIKTKYTVVFAGNITKQQENKIIKGGDDELDIDISDIEQAITETSKEVEIKKEKTGKIRVSEYLIYPEDNVFDFKKKIQLATNIPLYRQHVFFVYDKRIFVLDYKVILDNAMYINIFDVETSTNLLYDIPIDQYLYDNKDSIKVEAYDFFKLMYEYYTKYKVLEFNVMDLNEILGAKKSLLKNTDKYETELIWSSFIIKYYPMLTPDLFKIYLNNEHELSKYNVSVTNRVLETQFNSEKNIINDVYEYKSNKSTELDLAITSTTVDVLPISSESSVNIRNLFDYLELTKDITWARANLKHEGNQFEILKVYQNSTTLKFIIPNNSICINVLIKDTEDFGDVIRSMQIIILKNGKYKIKAKWREEFAYEFKDVIKTMMETVNPVIKKINTIHQALDDFQFELLRENNAIFSEINTSIFWRKIIPASGFKQIKEILNPYIVADIIKTKGGSDYYWIKGMHKFQYNKINDVINTNNWYECLSDESVMDKWSQLYERKRIIKLMHRTTDVKIEVIGMKDIEFNIFYRYIAELFSGLNIKSTKEIHESDRKVGKLKEQDPLLYDFRKIYNSPLRYATLCQKQQQPDIFSTEEIALLSKSERDKLFEYYNYTKDGPAYYSCPNKKYPYLKFIANKHPKKYCIPCCFKSLDKEDPVYKTCLTTHESYTNEEVRSSTHVMSYGKIIEVYRLGRLPEETLEPLFYDINISDKDGNMVPLDEDCMQSRSTGYYLYGVPQVWYGKPMGLGFCLAHIMGLTMCDFIDYCVQLIKKSNMFSGIFGGILPDYFKDLDEFKSAFKGISKFNDWNNLFMEIFKLYSEYIPILFEDNHGNGRVVLKTLSNETSETFVPSKTNRNYVIIEKVVDRYYPVYLIDIGTYLRRNKVNIEEGILKKSYTPLSEIVGTIRNMVASDEIYDISLFNLSLLNTFILDNPNYVIEAQLTNSSGLCYAIKMKYKNEKLYVPINHSIPFNNIVFEPFKRKSTYKWITVKNFISAYNSWVMKKSVEESSFTKKKTVEPIYPLIKIDNVLKYRNKTIGFAFGSLNFYGDFDEIKGEELILNHDPDNVNNAIFNNDKPVNDFGDKNDALYEYYNYTLFAMHLYKLLKQDRNTTLRNSIYKIIKGISNKNNKLVELSALIKGKGYFTDFKRIKYHVNNYLNIHNDKNQLLDNIKKDNYEFDYITIEKIKKVDSLVAYNILNKLALKFITFKKYKRAKFDNVLTDCMTSYDTGYCIRNKIFVPKSKYKNYLEIIIMDIKNEFNTSYMINNIIDYSKFIKRDNENIIVNA